MISRPEFFSGHRLAYSLANGHLNCTCKVLNYVTQEEEYINFIHDTGAFISTLSRNLYEQFEFDKINVSKHDVELGSYNSVTKGLVFTLPFLFVANFTVKNVIVTAVICSLMPLTNARRYYVIERKMALIVQVKCNAPVDTNPPRAKD